jgi:hypothetical protein
MSIALVGVLLRTQHRTPNNPTTTTMATMTHCFRAGREVAVRMKRKSRRYAYSFKLIWNGDIKSRSVKNSHADLVRASCSTSASHHHRSVNMVSHRNFEAGGSLHHSIVYKRTPDALEGILMQQQMSAHAKGRRHRKPWQLHQ